MYRKYFAKGFRTVTLATGSALLFCSAAWSTPVTGGSTTVNLNPSTLTTLLGFGFSVAPLTPGTANLGANPPTVAFPITGGDTTTSIMHAGGLAFTRNGIVADVQNFVINLSGANANTLTGQLISGGMTTNNFVIFDIGAGNSLTVDANLGSALSTVYGIPNLTGAPVGTAVVNATTAATPEPANAALVGIGIFGVLALLRKRIIASNA